MQRTFLYVVYLIFIVFVQMGECSKCRVWVHNIVPYACDCPTTRVCTKCGQEKELSAFHVDKRANHFSDGKFFPRKYKRCCAKCTRKRSRSSTVMARKRMVRPRLGTACDWCGKTTEKLVFEHCHKTEAFRGWVCRRCNTGLGLLGDGPVIIERARAYFGRSEEAAMCKVRAFSGGYKHVNNTEKC